MILIAEPDHVLTECFLRACKRHRCLVSYDPLTALDKMRSVDATMIYNDPIADNFVNLIFVDVSQPAVNGFTFINELASYDDLSLIPIVLISSEKIKIYELLEYSIVASLDPNTMLPSDISELADKYDHHEWQDLYYG